MLKRIAAIFLACLMAGQPLLASAADLNAAFRNLLGPGAAAAVNEPGYYQSSARNSFTAGGIELRVPRQTGVPQLFSATPPRISAGCGGISAHFGGFSFISGEEFEKLLKSIASGAALGFVSMMVLKTLCPQCEAVVQFLKSAAQQAARLAKDSCQWGRDLGRKFFGGETSDSPVQNICGTTVTDTGTESDFLSAMGNACQSLTRAVDSLLGENPATQGDSDAAKAALGNLQCYTGMGNITWARLRGFDSGKGSLPDSSKTGMMYDAYANKVLLMNLLGVELGPTGENQPRASCERTADDGVSTIRIEYDPESKNNYCPPTITLVDDVVGLFLCGSVKDGKPNGSTASSIDSYCSTYFKTGMDDKIRDTEIYQCADPENCNQVVPGTAAILRSGEGFLVQVHNTLMYGVNAVRSNKPFVGGPNSAEDNARGEALLKLMQRAPYPLYQVINAAAVYPAAAGDLINSMSVLIAEQLTVGYLDEALRMPGRQAGDKVTCLSPQQADKILEMVGKMRAANRQRLAQMGQNLTIQEAMSEQIRQLNIAIQRQVMNSDMLSQNKFAQAMANSVTPNISQSTAPGTNAP